MQVFLHILTQNIIPIFTVVLLGYLIDKKFDINIFTLSKLNFYIFVPIFVLVYIYTTNVPVEMMNALVFSLLMLIFNFLLSKLLSKVAKYDKGYENSFINSVMFYNAGNIGIPLITLVFRGTEYLSLALTTQIMVLMIQNISLNTLGFFNAGRANMHWKNSIIKILKMPTIYAIPLAFILKAFSYDFTVIPIWPALEYIKDGLVPIALITLGVQLSKTKFDFSNKHIYLSSFSRLIIGPILGLVIILALGIEGTIARVLLISAGLPSAVNTALIAVEFDNRPDFSSQVVMTSTIFSSVTLSLVIMVAKLLFPI